jgi:hypothetical protein
MTNPQPPVPERPPASEAEALHYLPALYSLCHWMVFADGEPNAVNGRRQQAGVLLDQVAPTWGAYFVKETFNRSLRQDGARQVHLSVFGLLSAWMGAIFHLSLALKQTLQEGDQRGLESLRDGDRGTPQFMDGEPCFWLNGDLEGSNQADGQGMVQCYGMAPGSQMPMGAAFERPGSHLPVWFSFEGKKLVLNRRQEDADKVLDPDDRCWFCQDKFAPFGEKRWLFAMGLGAPLAKLHGTCMFLPTCQWGG